MIDLKTAFEKHSDDFIKFHLIKNKLHQRPDLHAFLLLDKLVPGTRDMVCAAEHDEIYLDVGPKELAKVATDEDILELVRCGVRYDGEGLCVFV